MHYTNTKIKENPKDPEKIIGKRFHDLTPIEFLGYKKISEERPEKGYFYKCRCECGRYRITISHRLKTGTVRHCKNCKNKKLKEYHDSIGKKFHHLTVKEISRDSKNIYKIIALCDCDCGRKNKKIRLSNILSGMSRSCGCLNKREPFIIHGLSNRPFYSILLGINYRCKNPKNYHYFQKGITVCKDWDLTYIPKRKSTLRRFFELEEAPFEHICYMYKNDLIRIFNEHPYGKEWKRKLDLEILNPDSDLYKIHPREVIFYRYQNVITSAKIWAQLLGVNESTFNVQINRVIASGKTFQYLMEIKHPEYKETIDLKLKDLETIEQLRQNPYVQFLEDEDYVVNTYPKSWTRLLDLGFTLFLDFSDRLYISRTHWKLSNNSIKNTIVSPSGKQYYSF